MKNVNRLLVMATGVALSMLALSGCALHPSSHTPSLETRVNSGETDKFAVKACGLWKKYGHSKSKFTIEPGVSATMGQVKKLIVAEGKYGAKLSNDPNFDAEPADKRVALCKLKGGAEELGLPGKKLIVIYVASDGFQTGFVYAK